MDLIDLFWNWSQEAQIRDVRREVDRLDLDRANARDAAERLIEENATLRLRLGLLVRLLISKGVITAQEYAALIADAGEGPDGADG